MALFACAEAWNFPPFRKRFEGHFVQGTVDGLEVALLFPHTYMNLSGRSVGAALRSLDIANNHLIVLHDDVDLPFGRIRVKEGGGHGGHNGLKSIIGCTGGRISSACGWGWAVRQATTWWITCYLPFFSEEKQALPQILEKSVEVVQTILNKGATYAMNAFNGKA
jgi:PTH1 family peptidyl-tRNA hydrolase